MKESELYEPVKQFFSKQGYEVYAEVSLPHNRRRVDVIAKLPGAEHKLIAVEMKTSFSKELVAQAVDHRKLFPYVYVVIPERQRAIPAEHQERLLYHGIGILEIVGLGELKLVKVRQQALFQVPKVKLRKSWDQLLLPEHQTWLAGGSAGGGYVTTYALSMRKIRAYLELVDDWQSGQEIADALKGLHWARPSVQLVESLNEYEQRWVESKKIGRRWHFRIRRERDE